VAPVLGSFCSIFCSTSERYLGSGYLMHEVLQPSPPITSLLRCKRVFEALAALHAKGFPHGDARLPNLLQRSSGELAWIDVRSPTQCPAAFAADREVLAASVLGARRGGAEHGLVEAALDAVAAAAQGAGYGELAVAVHRALSQG
jgi:tRNA A-37 threonylcarbamoyl transferase component Bud32